MSLDREEQRKKDAEHKRRKEQADLARASDRAQRLSAALLVTEREAAILLGVSASQVRLWRNDGLLVAVRLPGLRAVRFARRDVENLAQRWIDDARGSAA